MVLAIQLRREPNELVLHYENDRVVAFSAEYLRVHAPEAVAERVLISRKRDVRLLAVKPVGIFALRLTFNDGYASGEYAWDYLERLGHEQVVRWRHYLHRLERDGLSRD